MIRVLVDHVAQHASSLLLIALTAKSAAAPGDLFPRQQTQFVTHIEYDARLLMMAQANEVGPKILNQPHLPTN